MTPDNNNKQQRKPIMYYYAVVMVILMMLNLFVIPKMQQAQIVDANYSTFVEKTEEGKVDKVQKELSTLSLTAIKRTPF